MTGSKPATAKSIAWPTSRLKKTGGFSLIELLVVLAVFSVVTGMIYSVYSGFIRNAVLERKVAKTELDLASTFWPLTKEIGSAGFGLAKSGTGACVLAQAIAISGSELTIHSTASGDDALSGTWGYVSGGCATGITYDPAQPNVVLINNLDKSLVASVQIGTGGVITGVCDTDYRDTFAYWIPYQSGGDLQCYETKYSLRAYDAGTKPAMCAAGAQKLSRSVSRTTTTNYEPMLDCMQALHYRFGCINASGALTWQTGSSCGTSKLKLIKVGMIIQSSTRTSTQTGPSMTLFEDLGSSLVQTVSLTAEQRNYRWKKRELLISLRNLE